MAFRDLSIGQKLHRVSLFASLSALLPAAVVFAVYDIHTIRDLMRHRILTEAQFIGSNCVTALLFNDPQTVTSTLSALKAEPHAQAAGVYTQDGILFASYLRAGMGPEALDKRLAMPVTEGHHFSSDHLVVVHPVVFEAGQIGAVVVRADVREIRQRLQRYAFFMVFVLATSILTASVISGRMQRAISRPIQHLASLAATVSTQKDYSVRAVAYGHDEMGALIKTFNEMLAQIQEQDAALRESQATLERRVEERTLQLERRSQELAAANKELEAFSYSVSHDLRAPLRGIDGFSKALLEDYSDKVLDAQGTHYLRRIRVATQRMAELIDDLLQLARLTRADLVRRPVDVSKLANAVAADLARRDPARTVDVRVTDGLTAQADLHLVTIVLENLLGNAWKFTGKRSDAKIEVGAANVEGVAAYYVRDNGAGFDMEYADKLFGVFQRLHAASDFEGTGIGLATVHRIISRHGGRIWAESAVGQGATFYFTLGETT
jgi:signal transduction histidine kinase